MGALLVLRMLLGGIDGGAAKLAAVVKLVENGACVGARGADNDDDVIACDDDAAVNNGEWMATHCC